MPELNETIREFVMQYGSGIDIEFEYEPGRILKNAVPQEMSLDGKSYRMPVDAVVAQPKVKRMRIRWVDETK